MTFRGVAIRQKLAGPVTFFVRIFFCQQELEQLEPEQEV
jgi:hypothetical protein